MLIYTSKDIDLEALSNNNEIINSTTNEVDGSSIHNVGDFNMIFLPLDENRGKYSVKLKKFRRRTLVC
ncbi:hypothetical protein KHA80_05460 [Anaerobacillus sp. HL2]|nr:hypothetical protein KHA80_05460 [Anaerobacillus sp. HL2]